MGNSTASSSSTNLNGKTQQKTPSENSYIDNNKIDSFDQLNGEQEMSTENVKQSSNSSDSSEEEEEEEETNQNIFPTPDSKIESYNHNPSLRDENSDSDEKIEHEASLVEVRNQESETLLFNDQIEFLKKENMNLKLEHDKVVLCLSKYLEQVETMSEERVQLNSQISDLNNEIEANKTNINNLNDELNQVKDRLENENVNNNKLTIEKSEFFMKNLDLRDEIARTNEKLLDTDQNAIKMNEKLNNECNRLKIELEALKQENVEIKMQNETNLTHLTEYSNKLNKAEKAIKEERDANQTLISDLNISLKNSQVALIKLKEEATYEAENLKNENLKLKALNQMLNDKSMNQSICNQDLIERINKLEVDYKNLKESSLKEILEDVGDMEKLEVEINQYKDQLSQSKDSLKLKDEKISQLEHQVNTLNENKFILRRTLTELELQIKNLQTKQSTSSKPVNSNVNEIEIKKPEKEFSVTQNTSISCGELKENVSESSLRKTIDPVSQFLDDLNKTNVIYKQKKDNSKKPVAVKTELSQDVDLNNETLNSQRATKTGKKRKNIDLDAEVIDLTADDEDEIKIPNKNRIILKKKSLISNTSESDESERLRKKINLSEEELQCSSQSDEEFKIRRKSIKRGKTQGTKPKKKMK